MSRATDPRRQAGSTYIEILIAASVVAIALLPAVDGLYTAMRGADTYAGETTQQYSVLAKMEDVLAEPMSLLIAAAEAAGDSTTPTGYSDPPGASDRRIVFVSLYDADNLDGDGNVFTVLDPDLDGDKNPYTGYWGVIWVRVEASGSTQSLASLVAP